MDEFFFYLSINVSFFIPCTCHKQKRTVKKMHLLNDKNAWGLGIQVTGGKDSIEEGNHGIFISHIMDDGAAARLEANFCKVV